MAVQLSVKDKLLEVAKMEAQMVEIDRKIGKEKKRGKESEIKAG